MSSHTTPAAAQGHCGPVRGDRWHHRARGQENWQRCSSSSTSVALFKLEHRTRRVGQNIRSWRTMECRGRVRVPSESVYHNTHHPRHCTNHCWLWRASRTSSDGPERPWCRRTPLKAFIVVSSLPRATDAQVITRFYYGQLYAPRGCHQPDAAT